MSHERRFFGTDGIRGRVGEPPITPEFVMKLGWAAGRVLGRGAGSRVLIGKDTRISGYVFESALEAGLASAGVDVGLLGPMPTPAIAYLTRTFRADAGIVISASHNPFHDNGIKFFSPEGQKLPDEVELEIERALELPLEMVAAERVGKARRIDHAAGRYIEFCKSTVPISTSLEGLRIVLDCAHGATYHIAPHVFGELRARVTTMGVSPDGLNINADCGSTRPQALQRAVVEARADLGIALDGDGDRVVMVDDRGEVVDGDELLYIIARGRYAAGELHGVVGTVMSNFGLEEALNALDVPLSRAQVGDRYVLENLRANGWTLGGESSGHIICLDRTTTGDGIVAALQVLAEMRRTGKSLRELRTEMPRYPQVLVNVSAEDKKAVLNAESVQRALADAEAELNGHGRILLRPSGTEPLVRIMVEGRDAANVERIALELKGVITGVTGAA
ncbi:MAG: phosphoglucosamine mutase [Chromatiales bacterium]|nr:phosphoglucosamine mutase [Chromatiales bacterium]